MQQQISAYWDDISLITIEVPSALATKHLSFYIDNTNELVPLEIENCFVEKDMTIYTITSIPNLSLDQSYILLDNHYNRFPLQFRRIVQTNTFDNYFYYEQNDLGATHTLFQTTFKIWAPTAETVLLVINKEGASRTCSLDKLEKGVWMISCVGNYDGASYYYLVKRNGQWIETNDPYGIASLINSGHSVVINKERLLNVQRCQLEPYLEQSIIYEMSVATFTSSAFGFSNAGKYLGLTESIPYKQHAIGLDYLKQLGVTHIQLLDIYDFGNVDEVYPEIANQQYDTMQFNVPEGSYASATHDAYSRILELQKAVQLYHDNGFHVTMAIDFSHVYKLHTFSMEKIIPGYMYRINDDFKRTHHSLHTHDIASERLMMRHFIISSLIHWTSVYGIDGFKFNLINLMDRQTIQLAHELLKTIYPHILLYGNENQQKIDSDSLISARSENAWSLPEMSYLNDFYYQTIQKVILNPNTLTEQTTKADLEEVLSGSIGRHNNHKKMMTPLQSINYVELANTNTFFDLVGHSHTYSLNEQKRASHLAIELLLISQGIPMLHSGQEFFHTHQNNSTHTFDWNRLIDHYDNVQQIMQWIAFRKNYPQFFKNNREDSLNAISFHWYSNTLLCYRIKQDDSLVEYIINFSNKPTTYINEHLLPVYATSTSVNEATDIFGEITVAPFSICLLKQD